MTLNDIAHHRLASQQIAGSACRQPAEVVSRLGAMQAQDFAGTLWAIGLRLPGSTEKSVEQALAKRSIVRTWLMRGTLHFVAAADIRWMLDLMAPRMIAGSAGRARQLELDAAIFARCRELFVRALRDNRQLTRIAMMDLLKSNGISTASQRGYHILWRLAQEGLICFAARSAKQQTFALLDEWISCSNKLDREEALAELVRRYFTGHGPATVQDFAWWAGLKISDAKAAVHSIQAELLTLKCGSVEYRAVTRMAELSVRTGQAQLLPGFDEYLLGYKDRSAALEARHVKKILPAGNGLFLSTIVMDGRVVGTWKRGEGRNFSDVASTFFAAPNRAEKMAFALALDGYKKFAGTPAASS